MKLKFLLPLLGLTLAVKLSFNIYRIWRAGDRITAARVKLEQVQKEQAELKKQLAWVQSPEFIEKEAREKLGYGKDGEIIVILPKNDEIPNHTSQIPNKPNWKRWWDLYIGI